MKFRKIMKMSDHMFTEEQIKRREKEGFKRVVEKANHTIWNYNWI